MKRDNVIPIRGDCVVCLARLEATTREEAMLALIVLLSRADFTLTQVQRDLCLGHRAKVRDALAKNEGPT